MAKFIFAFLFVLLAVSAVLSMPDYDNEKDDKSVNGAPKTVLAALKQQGAGLVHPKVDVGCRNGSRRTTTTAATRG